MKRIGLAFLLVLVLSAGIPVSLKSQEIEISVMTFNVWSGENTPFGRSRLRLIMEESNADVIGVQEMGDSEGQAIAQQLGFFYHQQSGSGIQIISRYPIADSSPQNFGALIEITPDHRAWIFNCHLAPYPYQPYDLRDGSLPMNEAAVVAAAESARGAQINSVLQDMTSALATDLPVFLVGDFNEPSQLDWTQEAADSTTRPFDLKVDYPASIKITNSGLHDSFRVVRPGVVNDRGYTWTPGYPPPSLNSNEVHDRIDIVYYRGTGVTARSSTTIGLDQSNPNTDVEFFGYNSDHRAVVSQFSMDLVDRSTLDFADLTHNPGNDSALNAGDYGDRLAATPNIVLEFSATGASHWDTYDGDFDANGNNNWNGGVGQLQFVSGSAEYDLRFTPDAGYGTIVDSFQLVDYVDFAVGHSVNWEIWSGLPDEGSLLASDSKEIPVNGICTVETGLNSAVYGLATLRVEHLLGDGTDLAIDNVKFRQLADKTCNPGDINMDGQLNLLDVAPFVILVSSSEFQCEADLNQDGSVDLLDVSPFVQSLSGN